MFWGFLFDRHLEVCLQNRSVLCICSGACSLSLVSGFAVAAGVSVTVVIYGVTVSALSCGVRFSVILLCSVLFQVLNAGGS